MKLTNVNNKKKEERIMFDAIGDIFGAIFMSILNALGLLNFGW